MADFRIAARGSVDFGDSYLKYGETLLIKAGDATVKSKDDLKNIQIIVGVQTGTSNEQTALKLVADQKKQIKRFDTLTRPWPRSSPVT